MRYALGSMWAVVLFLTATATGMDSAPTQRVEKALGAIQECMSRAAVPWPDNWNAEYLGAIRRAITFDANLPGAGSYAACLDVLARGFEPYWQSLSKGKDRALFEFQLAQIRWYAESLVGKGLPNSQDKQKLRDQYGALWNDAASALTVQFPFLDPNVVRKAKDDFLADSCRKIDAPLLPIFQRPPDRDPHRTTQEAMAEPAICAHRSVASDYRK